MLTTKKRLYAEAWMRGENKTKSAILAGYSPKSAKYKGHELSKNVDVLEYIERLKKNAPINDISPAEDSNPPQEKDVESPQVVKPVMIDDPLIVMRKIMNDNLLTDPKLSLDAASKLAPYVAIKMGESGKKEAKNTAAKKATGAFIAMSPPKLIVNNSN